MSKHIDKNRRKFISQAVKITSAASIGASLTGISNALTPELVLFNYGYITPSTGKDEYSNIGLFPNTNNLRRKPGSPFLAKGEPLNIEGTITDLMDIPIEGMRVKIWHTNHMGYYNYFADQSNPNEYDPDFLGSGMCVTNNIGYFSFLTIVPGRYGKRAPHIHILCEHSGYESLETEIFLEGNPHNEKDPKYMEMNERNQILLTASVRSATGKSDYGKYANFNIKINELHKSKRI